MLAQDHWDTKKAKEVAQTILKTKDQTVVHNRNMKEMKTQMLDYMKGSKLANFPMEDSNKTLVAVESPVRLTLVEAIRVKFTQDGTDPRTIDDWLKEVKEIRRAGVKSVRKVMKIAKIRKEKKVAAAKAEKGAKGTRSGKAAKEQKEPSGKKPRVRFASSTETNESKEASLEPNAPMLVVEGKSND
jgi:hypothetical protein